MSRASRGSGLEPVAHARLGHEIAWLRGVRLELAANLGEIDAEVVRFLLVLRAPDALQKLPLRDQPAGMTDERLDDLPLGRGQADLLPVSLDALGGEVGPEVSGLDDGFLLVSFGGPEKADDGLVT